MIRRRLEKILYIKVISADSLQEKLIDINEFHLRRLSLIFSSVSKKKPYCIYESFELEENSRFIFPEAYINWLLQLEPSHLYE